MTEAAIQPDAQGHFIAPGDWYAGMVERLATPGAPTATECLAKVLTVLDDLDEPAEIAPCESATELDFKRGVGYAVERVRDVLPPADGEARHG